jgi:hypothetical protein
VKRNSVKKFIHPLVYEQEGKPLIDHLELECRFELSKGMKDVDVKWEIPKVSGNLPPSQLSEEDFPSCKVSVITITQTELVLIRTLISEAKRIGSVEMRRLAREIAIRDEA